MAHTRQQSPVVTAQFEEGRMEKNWERVRGGEEGGWGGGGLEHITISNSPSQHCHHAMSELILGRSSPFYKVHSHYFHQKTSSNTLLL